MEKLFLCKGCDGVPPCFLLVDCDEHEKPRKCAFAGNDQEWMEMGQASKMDVASIMKIIAVKQRELEYLNTVLEKAKKILSGDYEPDQD